jgi:hypothetical protein
MNENPEIITRFRLVRSTNGEIYLHPAEVTGFLRNLASSWRKHAANNAVLPGPDGQLIALDTGTVLHLAASMDRHADEMDCQLIEGLGPTTTNPATRGSTG